MSKQVKQAADPFDNINKRTLLQVQRDFIEALKSKNFGLALDKANIVLTIDPNNAMIQQYVPLLQEKLDLETSSEESSDDAADGDANGNAATQADESTSSTGDNGDETSEESSEAEDEDEATEEDSPEPEPGPASSLLLDPEIMRDGLKAIQLDPNSSILGHAGRTALRTKLASRVKDIREKQIREKLVASDPLLGA